MINSKQKKITAITAMTVFLGIMIGLTQDFEIYAEEVEEKKYTQANEVAIHTTFTFRAGVEESDGFQVFKQISGFDRASEAKMFKLEGVVDFDRAYLYEAADMSYKRGIQDRNHMYGDFDVDVYLHKDGESLRHFKYTDCRVVDYKVTTLFDKEEGWTTSKGFAIVDEFEFQCNAYSPNNPLYELMKTNGYKVNTKSSIDYQAEQRDREQ